MNWVGKFGVGWAGSDTLGRPFILHGGGLVQLSGG